MLKALSRGGLMMAPVAFMACMESSAPTSPGAGKPAAARSDLARAHVEEAFPGRTGDWKEGYYRGDKIAYQVIDGKNVLEGDIVLDDSEISAAPPLPKASGAAT